MQDVVVFGSINMDVVTFGERHPRIGETVLGKRVAFFPGGKGANQAVAAARCAGTSILIGGVGADGFGEQMLAHLKSNGVETSVIAVIKDISTGVAVIVVDDKGQNTIVITPGANDLAQAPEDLSLLTKNKVIALAQFESPVTEIVRFFRLVRASGGITILNPSPYQTMAQELLQLTSVMILNEHEFCELIGEPTTDNPQDIMGYARSKELPVPCCVVTLGGAGFVLAQKDCAPVHVLGQKVTPIDTTGAGDCFAGWFAAELATGCSFEAAARRANVAAAISVTRAGAGSSMPSKAEVSAFA